MISDVNLHIRGKLCPEVAPSLANDLVPRYFETGPMPRSGTGPNQQHAVLEFANLMLSLAMPGERKKGQTPKSLPSERVVAKKTAERIWTAELKLTAVGRREREKRGSRINHWKTEKFGGSSRWNWGKLPVDPPAFRTRNG